MSRSATVCLGQPVQFEESHLLLGTVRKSKINLPDYDYQRDIKNRLLMADFSLVDVEILREVLLSSLTLSLSALAAAVDLDPEELLPTLEKLESVGLLRRTGETLELDKEMRKYYEAQVLKFDDDFEPNMEFLQGLLRKVPIHVLPVWYAIPRSSSNIFDSLVERFFETPRAFQRYLLELQLEEPLQRLIVNRLFASPELSLPSSELREELSLSREEFEEHMLYLEFNFVCCLSYCQTEEGWEEVVTPFHEWRQFILFRQQTMPQPISQEAKIDHLRTAPFSIVTDMTSMLRDLRTSPMRVAAGSRPYFFAIDDLLMNRLATVCGVEAPLLASRPVSYRNYFSQLLGKLVLIEFVNEEDGLLSLSERGEEWLALGLEERAIALYRHPFNTIISREIDPQLNSERNLREIERALERVADLGWVEMEDFLRGVIAPIGSAGEVTLQKKGRRWRYALPTYSQEEKELIRAAILERLFEGGFVEVGELEGASLFRVTPFGRAVVAGGSTDSH